MGKTLFDKVWDAHVVRENEDGSVWLYIDRHLVHEVTSPQAFEGLRLHGRRVWRPATVVATPDHNVPTLNRERGIEDPISRAQVEALDRNCAEFGILEFGLDDPRQGIVHVVGPEEGLTLPGMTVVCGDSHTSTHGAFGAIAFGIGTTQVEQVLATQCLTITKPKRMRVRFSGVLPEGVYAKDMALFMIATIGTAGGTGYAIEYAGEAVEALSMEGRMTLCNMTIEAGARCGMVAVDEKTIAYLRDRPFAPKGELWEAAVASWRELRSDPDAAFDAEHALDVSDLEPFATWGTSPEMGVPITGSVPRLADARDAVQRHAWEKALAYMGLKEGMRMQDIPIDKVFIGSCTNARIEDLREAARIVRGRKVAGNVKLAMVVPGSGLVKRQAEAEGLDRIFKEAGFSWRDPGCSMCLAMNADRLEPGERCAATSNRNFEGRQGRGGRTHLMSPAAAAASAIAGRIADPREFL